MAEFKNTEFDALAATNPVAQANAQPNLLQRMSSFLSIVDKAFETKQKQEKSVTAGSYFMRGVLPAIGLAIVTAAVVSGGSLALIAGVAMNKVIVGSAMAAIFTGCCKMLQASYKMDNEIIDKRNALNKRFEQFNDNVKSSINRALENDLSRQPLVEQVDIMKQFNTVSMRIKDIEEHTLNGVRKANMETAAHNARVSGMATGMASRGL